MGDSDLNQNNPPAQGGGASQGNNQPTSTPAQSPPGDASKFALTPDGRMTYDGRKLVFESDLIAAKESVQKQLKDEQERSQSTVDGLKMNLSSVQKEHATASARIHELEEALNKGAASVDEAAGLKKQLEDAQAANQGLSTRLSEAMKSKLNIRYGIPTEKLEGKTLAELESVESALGILPAPSGGLGNYAVGGSSEGSQPLNNTERALRAINSTPQRGQTPQNTQ